MEKRVLGNEMGYTLFDTAEVYGSEDNPHQNEEVVAGVMEGLIKAADIKLTGEEVRSLDEALDKMEMSEVFGGSKIVSFRGAVRS